MNTTNLTEEREKMQTQKTYSSWIMLFILFIFTCGSISAQSDVWATAYYAGWMQGQTNNGHLPAQDIDYSAVTHIVHFALMPNANGTLDAAANSVTQTNSAELISRAHANGVKVLISIGGWNSGDGFIGATNPLYLTTFVTNLVNFMVSRGYDGIDLDWEPLRSSDGTLFVALVTALRTAMDIAKPGALLTAANGSEVDIFAQVHQHFDQINLMTYDMSGPWPGWVTWHNSPVYDGGFNFPSTGKPVPSANTQVDAFINAGVPAEKIGIGIDFYGYIWNGGDGTPTGGVTKPRQGWTVEPWMQGNVPYYTIMDNYYQSQYYGWDDGAKAAYLSIDNSGSSNDKFISYDDEQTVQAKFDYARSKGIGGLIVWEIGGGYRPNMPQGQRDPLLQAVKSALHGGSTADVTLPTVAITSPASGASLTGVTTLAATATDNVGVVGVQFKVDGTNAGNEVTAAPFTTSLDASTLSAGTHTISAVARDAAGNTKTASVNVTITIPTSDTTPPTVALTSPVNGTTVNGTITVGANTSDNVGVVGVQFKIDGSTIGSELLTSPYSILWNTAQTTNGSHTLSVVARDAAGNTNTSSVTVNVSNSSGDTPGVTNSLVVYDDQLQTLWESYSWGSTLNFNSTEKSYTGSSSIKAQVNSWGALSLHYGENINPANYQSMKFAVYPTTSNTKLSVYFQNDQGQSFPGVNYESLAANQWTVVSIPMSQLNPNNQVFNRVSIQESNGSNITFFVDEFSFIGDAAPSAPAAPVLASPTNGLANVQSNPTLNWADVNGAESYNLQVSTSSSFGTTVVDKGGSTTTSYSANGLANSTTYYWRVNATNTNGTSEWSPVFNFTTTGSQTVSPELVVYEESLESPWISTSWGTTLTFDNTAQVSEGNYSVKVVQGGWGALRLRNGSWGSPVDIITNNYGSFDFTIYGGAAGVTLGVYFENDNKKESFPTVDDIQVAANEWKTVSIPISQLNPNNNVVHNITFQNFTSQQKTYYVDNIRFMSSSGTQSLAKTTETEETEGIPETFALNQNYPNPFNPSTTISFNLPEQSDVTLKIYNLLGEEVATLISGTLSAGSYRETWDASNFTSGIYIYQLRSGNNVLIKKMNLVK